jgi:hypothetical protein
MSEKVPERRPGGLTPDVSLRWLLVVVAATVTVDQVSKLLAWRVVDGAVINPGSGVVAPWLDTTYSAPLTGALLDLLNVVVLATASVLTVRRVRDPLLWWAASLSIAGWTSNLLDRLGAHWLTAPGSRRGTVDWLQGNNLADVVIWTGSALLVAWLAREVLREVGWDLRAPRHRAGLALVVCVLAVALLAGMASMDGRTRPPGGDPPDAATASVDATSRCDDPAYALSPANVALCRDDPAAAHPAEVTSATTCSVGDDSATVQVTISNPNRDRPARFTFATRGDVRFLAGGARGQVDAGGAVRARLRIPPRATRAAVYLETSIQVWDAEGARWIVGTKRVWTSGLCGSDPRRPRAARVDVLCAPTGTARVVLVSRPWTYRDDHLPVVVSWRGGQVVTTDASGAVHRTSGFTVDLAEQFLTTITVAPESTPDVLVLDGWGPGALQYDGAPADTVTVPVGRCLVPPKPFGGQ